MSRDDDREYLATSPDGNARVFLVPFPDGENPRRDGDCYVTHAVIFPDREYCAPDPDGGPLADVWDRMVHRYGRSSKAVDAFDRYVWLATGGATREDCPHRGPHTVWYVTGPELDAAGISRDLADETLAGEQREYRAWADGEGLGWVIETRDVCDHPDHDVWTIVADCYGYYDHDFAVNVAMEEWTAHMGTPVPDPAR